MKPWFSYRESSSPFSFGWCTSPNIEGAFFTIFIPASGASDVVEAFGVSPVTRKSKTLIGSAFSDVETGGSGAAGGGSTIAIACLPVSASSASSASSTYALRDFCDVEPVIFTFFFSSFDGFSLYSAPWYFCSSEIHDWKLGEMISLDYCPRWRLE